MGNFLETNKQKTKKMVLISQQTGRKPSLLMVTVVMLSIIPTHISGFQTSKDHRDPRRVEDSLWCLWISQCMWFKGRNSDLNMCRNNSTV